MEKLMDLQLRMDLLAVRTGSNTDVGVSNTRGVCPTLAKGCSTLARECLTLIRKCPTRDR